MLIWTSMSAQDKNGSENHQTSDTLLGTYVTSSAKICHVPTRQWVPKIVFTADCTSLWPLIWHGPLMLCVHVAAPRVS